LNQLCKLIALFGVYGDERDQWIARSKIVLNMHYSDRQIIEQSRISYLLNNQRFVVSEDSSVNPYGQAIVTAPYNRLVDTCCDWLKKPKERDEMALVGYEHFRKKPMTHYLRQVIESFAR
jgi:hypothetical protein